MPKNRLAANFCKNLVAAFSRWPITAETKELYVSKLSKWVTSEAEWEAALDELIRKHPDGELPGLGEVWDELRRQKRKHSEEAALGWCYFFRKGTSHAIRVVSRHGEWVNAPVSITDASGRRVELQAHPWKPPNIPEDAEDVRYIADRPARAEPWEVPTTEEQKQYTDEIDSNVAALAELPF